MTNKDLINKKFKELEKFNFLVFNFSFNKFLPKSLKGFPDYLVIGKKKIYFLELKLKATKDKFRKEQKELKNKLIEFGFNYYEINEDNIIDIINTILSD